MRRCTSESAHNDFTVNTLGDYCNNQNNYSRFGDLFSKKGLVYYDNIDEHNFSYPVKIQTCKYDNGTMYQPTVNNSCDKLLDNTLLLRDPELPPYEQDQYTGAQHRTNIYSELVNNVIMNTDDNLYGGEMLPKKNLSISWNTNSLC